MSFLISLAWSSKSPFNLWHQGFSSGKNISYRLSFYWFSTICLFSLLRSSFHIILSLLLYSPRFFLYRHGFVLISLSVFLCASEYFLHFIFQKIHLSSKHSLFQLISQIACLVYHVANLQISFSRYLLYLSLFHVILLVLAILSLHFFFFFRTSYFHCWIAEVQVTNEGSPTGSQHHLYPIMDSIETYGLSCPAKVPEISHYEWGFPCIFQPWEQPY